MPRPRGKKFATKCPVWPVVSALRRRLRQCSRAQVRQAVLLIASFALYLTWGPWFAAVLLTSTVMNFLIGKWLRRKPSGTPLAIGIVLNLALAGHLQIPSGNRGQLFFIGVADLLASGAAVGYLVLDLPGDELPVRSLPREELDPIVLRIRARTWFSSRSRSRARSAACPTCCRNSAPTNPLRGTTSDAEFSRIATGVFMMQLAQLLGQGILAGDGINSGFDHVTHWSGADVWCLAFGYGLQLFFDFAGYSHIAIGAAKVLGFTVPENFDRAISIHHSVDLLDALAHVAVVLDSRLRLPSAGRSAPRSVVAQSRARHLDDPVRTVAQSKRALRVVGLLSRRAAGPASSGAASAAQVRLGTACQFSGRRFRGSRPSASSAWDGFSSAPTRCPRPCRCYRRSCRLRAMRRIF